MKISLKEFWNTYLFCFVKKIWFILIKTTGHWKMEKNYKVLLTRANRILMFSSHRLKSSKQSNSINNILFCGRTRREYSSPNKRVLKQNNFRPYMAADMRELLRICSLLSNLLLMRLSFDLLSQRSISPGTN